MFSFTYGAMSPLLVRSCLFFR